MRKLTYPSFILILGLLTLLLLLKFGDLDISSMLWQRIHWRYLGLGLVVHYSGFIVRGIRWQRLLAILGHHLPLGYTCALLMTGWFVSALIPARLGDVARVVMLYRDHRIGVSSGLASIFTERALDILTILLLTISATFWALSGQMPPQVWPILSGGLIFALLILALLFTMPHLEFHLISRFPWPIYQRLMKFGFDLLNSIRQLAYQPKHLLVVFGQSFYIWLCDIVLMYLIILGLGEALSFSATAFTSMIADLAAAIPLLPGAIGQFEVTAIASLRLFNISEQQSSAIILLNRLISFWSFLIISGLITYLFGFTQVLNSDALKGTLQHQQPLSQEP